MNMIAGIMEHFHNGMPFVVGIFILYIVNFILFLKIHKKKEQENSQSLVPKTET